MTAQDLGATRRRPARRQASLFSRFWRWEASGVLVALVVLTLLLSLAADNFLTAYNMGVVARNAAFVGLVALGQTLVLLVGGIDLSVGAAAGLSAIVGSIALTQWGLHPWLVVPFTMLFGFALGS